MEEVKSDGKEEWKEWRMGRDDGWMDGWKDKWMVEE